MIPVTYEAVFAQCKMLWHVAYMVASIPLHMNNAVNRSAGTRKDYLNYISKH